jgi:hypothetical protein
VSEDQTLVVWTVAGLNVKSQGVVSISMAIGWMVPDRRAVDQGAEVFLMEELRSSVRPLIECSASDYDQALQTSMIERGHQPHSLNYYLSRHWIEVSTWRTSVVAKISSDVLYVVSL